MNKNIEQFARTQIKEGLRKLPTSHHVTFQRMYAHLHPEYTMEEVVDNMPAERLDWALTQVENSLRKLNIT